MLAVTPGNDVREEERRIRWVALRAEVFAALLLADSPAIATLARRLDMDLAEHYVLVSIRVPDPAGAAVDRREDVVGALVRQWPVPLLWEPAGELVALLPTASGHSPVLDEVVQRRALALTRDCTDLLNRSGASGMADGRTGTFAQVLQLARQISRLTPAERVPHRVYTVADVFVELSMTQLPDVNYWMNDLSGRLTAGPDLIATLEVYYRCDMSRVTTANALYIHPRTLDYRLRRVHDLIGINPGTTRGVRILTAVLAHMRDDSKISDPVSSHLLTKITRAD